MELLQAGVDRSVIALWLGHEWVETTQMYLDANIALKRSAHPGRWNSKTMSNEQNITPPPAWSIWSPFTPFQIQIRWGEASCNP
jgi:hypothetical protein